MRRRDFFKRTSPLLAAPFVMGGMRLSALANTDPFYKGFAFAGETDKVLVIVQLVGGNDGLNTVIPVEDDQYFNARPNLAISKEQSVQLDGQPLLGLHTQMPGMAEMFNDGTLSIVQNLGYNRMNLSHFAGTEIWNTASGSRKEDYLTTGWTGRYLQGEFPDFPNTLPDYPPAIEISPATSSIFTVVGASISMSLTDPQEFYDLVNAGPNVTDEVDVTTLAGREWEFIDSVNRQSVTFADGVRAAALNAGNNVLYPETDFAQSLAIIAQLVAGGLGTRIYKVSLGNFDTHRNQAANHAQLLETLSGGIKAFQDDLFRLGVADRVVGMTYSEFGRRVRENGSGTDHGTAAPHFVFGSTVDGGKVLGGLPDLSGIDSSGNLPHTTDFHCYYASIIAPLFGTDDAELGRIFPISLCDRPEFLPIYRTSNVEEYSAKRRVLSVAPNPADRFVRISLPKELLSKHLLLTLYNQSGESVSKQAIKGAGREFTLRTEHLPSGIYVLLVDNSGRHYTAQFVVRH